MSAGETSGEEFEVNELSRGKKWGNNSNYKRYNPNNNHSSRPQYNRTVQQTIKQVRLGNKRERTPRSP